MKREEKIARARELHGRIDPATGFPMSYAAVGKALGAAPSTVYRWLNPDAEERSRARARAWKARNSEATRAYDRQYADEHRGTCRACNGPMGAGVPDGVCSECRSLNAARRYVRLERLWNEGKTWPELCEALDCTRGTLAQLIDRGREQGYDLPYRYRSGKRAGYKFPEQVAA